MKLILERMAALVGGTRGKWITLVVWIVLIGVANTIWPGVNKVVRNDVPNLPDDRPSVQAAQVVKQDFPSTGGIPALLVWSRNGGLTDDDYKHIQHVAAYFQAHPLPKQSFIPPYDRLAIPALKTQASKYGSTFVQPISFENGTDETVLKNNLTAVELQVKKETGADPFQTKWKTQKDLLVRIAGPAGIKVDASGLFKSADFPLMAATVLLVLVLLLLIYRSPILAFIPIIAVAFAYGMISPLLGWMVENNWIAVDSQATSIMTVLLFGAGTDYCLFLISRYREMLRTEPDSKKALFHAVTGTTGAIAMSGLTVMISLLSLLVAHFGPFHRFSVPFSLSILVMGLASLTLVPAILAIVGRASFFPFIPNTPEATRLRAALKGKPEPKLKAQNRFGDAIGRLVIKRPLTIVMVTLILMGIFAGFSSQIKYTYSLLASFPDHMPSKEGFEVIADQFGPGELAPVKIIVNTQGKDTSLSDKLVKLPYVALVGKSERSKVDPNLLAIDVQLNIDPYSMGAMDRIPDIRAVAEQALADAKVEQGNVWIGGQTSEQYDTRMVTNQDIRTIIPIVIALLALLLFAYLRSLTAMIYLIGTVIFSFFSALGVGWLVIHYVMGADAIQGSIPLYSFVFLVALGEDYNIFMISSIWEKRRHMPLSQAIREGVGQTGSVITSAGLILAGTFSVLATLPIQILVDIGIITALGVLLDTFIVRPFLVPAITTLLGRFAFWPGR